MLSKQLTVVLLNAAAFVFSLPSASSATLLRTLSDADADTKNLLPNSLEENAALINVVPNAIDDIDLDEIRASLKDASFSPGPYEQKSISTIEMNPSVSARLRELVGGLPVGDNEMAKVMIIKEKSSVPHVDLMFDETTNQYIPMTSNDRSALFVVEVVGDALFRHADGSIPLEAGMFIHFRGDLEHYTHLNKGSVVTYLGPFNVNAFAEVARSLSAVDRSVEIFCFLGSPVTTAQGELKRADTRRQLEEGASDISTASKVEGEVVMGNLVDVATNNFVSNFLATDVTSGLPKDCAECVMNVAITNSEECTDEAHDKAMIIPLDQPIIYSTDEFGSSQGWQRHIVRELRDTNSTLPISLAELINQAKAFTDYHVAVFLYDANGELVACSNLKALDKDKAAEYDEELDAFTQTEEASPVDTTSESNVMFVSAITIAAAVGISLVLDDVLTL